jgi:4-hydroxybenzoate polyprenyltransferase
MPTLQARRPAVGKRGRGLAHSFPAGAGRSTQKLAIPCKLLRPNLLQVNSRGLGERLYNRRIRCGTAGARGIVRGYLELLRPANVVTALADVLAGYAVAGRTNHRALPWLLVATVCLYAGGVVLNDFFDRRLDAVERPERPIPSGRVSPVMAATLGGLLLAGGIAAAAAGTTAAALIALAIAALVLAYDARVKRYAVAGPLNMGLCRGCNLLLGVAAVPAALADRWAVALIAVVYITAVTVVSRGEVHGGKKAGATFALISLTGVLLILALLGRDAGRVEQVVGCALLALLAYRVLPPFWRARNDPSPAVIRGAVKAGVLSLVLVDAAISVAYAGSVYGASVLATALVAGSLARLFSVT